MSNFLNRQKRIGVLRGGGGRGHASSVAHGGEILAFIVENLYPKWRPIDIFVDRDGVWHLAGRPILPADIVHGVDLVWNTAGAEYQQILEYLSVPVLGRSAFASLLTNNPEAIINFATENRIKIPRKIVFPIYQPDFDNIGGRESSLEDNMEIYASRKAREVWHKFSPPWVVCAYNTDRNMARRVAKTFPQLAEAILELVRRGDSVLVEELIDGKLATTHLVPGFRGEEFYVFPIHSFVSLTDPEKTELSHQTRELYKYLGGQYLRVDFVIHPRTGVHLLEFDHHPDLKPESSLSLVSEAVGSRVGQVVSHIFERVL